MYTCVGIGKEIIRHSQIATKIPLTQVGCSIPQCTTITKDKIINTKVNGFALVSYVQASLETTLG